MQLRKVIPMYNEDMERLIKAGKFAKSVEAQFRLKVVEFSKKYGIKATEDAFLLSRTTIFRWKKPLKEHHGCIDSLIPQSRRPKSVRQMRTDTEIISFIREIREKHTHIGKEKIKPLLDSYCMKKGIKPISVSTIGKIIKRYNLTFNPRLLSYHNPNSGWAKRKKKRNPHTHVRYSPKIDEPHYVEIDTISEFESGIRRYIYNTIDVNTRFQFSYAFNALSSKTTIEFFKKFQEVYPIENGIHIKLITERNTLAHLTNTSKIITSNIFIYPRCSRINGYVERANRTLQEEFIDYSLELLFEDLVKFNSELIKYLIFYNTKRIHRGLNNLSPIDFVLKCYQEYKNMCS